MRKNKLAWNAAMLFVLIAMLPAAYAQTATGGWFFVIINAAIVGIALFMLQAFLIPGKNEKEQTTTWVAILVASFVIAFLFGRNGFLWQGPLGRFLDIHVIVNTLIIAIVGYFALGLLKIGKDIKSPEGNVGYGLLVFIGALVWAIGIQNSYGPVFIWQAYQYFISYFIGPEGILNPYPPQYRLLVFAGSLMLLAFFFQNYLLQDSKNPYVNYGLALILAMNMASSGVTIKSVIILGEIIFVLVLQKALLGAAKDKVWLSWLLSIGLVGWASAAMTYGTEYQGAIATPIGWILSWFGLVDAGTGTAGRWGYSGIVVFAIILIVGIILWSIFRNQGMLREGAKRVWKEALSLLRRNQAIGKFLTDTAAVKNPVLDGELQLELKDMRYETYLLWNFILRHEIFKFKTKGTGDMMKDAIKIERNLGERVPEAYDIYKNMKGWIEGGPVKYDENLKQWVQQGGTGWARYYIAFHEAMKHLRGLLGRDLTVQLPLQTVQDATKAYEKYLDELKGRNDTAYRRYSAGVRRYKAVNKIRALRLRFLDMLNLYGKYTRGYFFAKLHAKPDYYSYEIKESSDNKLHRKVAWNKVKKIGQETRDVTNYEEPTQKYLLELDMFGYCVKDINEIEIERKDLPYIRRFKKEDMVYLPRPVRDWLGEEDIDERNDLTDEQKRQMKQELNKEAAPNVVISEVFGLSLSEWEYFVRDMFRGSFHPMSKTILDYEHLITDVKMDFRDVHFRGILDQDKDIAFDREAIKHPGLFVYWGRRNYYDKNPESLKRYPVNPYPMASISGLWSFINKYSERLAGNPHETEMWLEQYARLNYQDLGKPIETGKKE